MQEKELIIFHKETHARKGTIKTFLKFERREKKKKKTSFVQILEEKNVI